MDEETTTTATTTATKSVMKKPNHIPITATADGIIQLGQIGTPETKDDPLVIGYICPCDHPTVIENLCAVCGQSMIPIHPSGPLLSSPSSSSSSTFARGERSDYSDTSSSAYHHVNDWNSHNSNDNDNTNHNAMSRITVSGGVTLTVSETEGLRLAQEDAERLRKLKKLSLVLDLDHTLVHATNDIRARQHLGRDDVRSLLLPMMETEPGPPSPPANYNDRPQFLMQHFVKFRPHVGFFLKHLLPYYEIGVYTAGTREYAEQITLLLARHVVNANMDQVDLDQLRMKIAKVQAELQASSSEDMMTRKNTAEALAQVGPPETAKEEPNNVFSDTIINGNITKTAAPPSKRRRTDAGTDSDHAMDVEPGNDDDETRQESKNLPLEGKKRKRVMFGEPPPDLRTDRTTQQHLDELLRQLEEAEQLEARAVEMRQRLFGTRVVSRTDVGDLGRDVKSLKRIFPCGGTMAAVVDDREDVWANAEEVSFAARPGEPPDNLLLVRPYHWDTFLGFADVNNAAGVDLSAASTAEHRQSESDQQLMWTTNVLERLHQRYYSYSGPDRPSVPGILRGMRSEVLAGCNVVLSGLVPLHKQGHDDADRARPAAVRYVECLGATLLPSVTSSVTHVVAAKDGTDKILAARTVPGCFIVKPSWLMECVWSVTKRDERPHLLGPPPVPVSNKNNGSSNKGSVRPPLADSTRENASSSSDEEDDELAAEMENEFMQED